MHQQAVGSRFALSFGFAQVPIYASAAARAAALEAEQVAQIAAGLLPPEATTRPTRLAELLITSDTDRAHVHDVLRDIAGARAQLLALEAAAIARLGEVQPVQQQLPGARPDDPADPDRHDDWVADEVGVVLGISVGSAAPLVDKARVLFEQLPRVWAAAADGLIDARRAHVLVDALAHRKKSVGGGLDDALVDTIAAHGLGWIAEGIGPTPLADRINGALIGADPAEGRRRAERRKRKQNVTSMSCGDGLASLRAELADAADVAEEIDVIDALAAVMRKNGDTRPMGQLRIAAHHQLITRPWEILPPDVAHAQRQLRLRVDLADLDGLGALLDQQQEATDAADDPPSETDFDTDAGALTDEPGHDTTTVLSTATSPDRPDERPGTSDPSDGPITDSTAGPDGCAPTGSPVAGPASDGRGTGVGSIGGWSVSPAAVAELLVRFDALAGVGPASGVDRGEVWFEIVDATGRLRSIASPAEARAAFRRGLGLAPPPAVDRYEPSAAQVRFVTSRDRHCRFPGCHRAAEYVDLDHVIAYDHDSPATGGPTCVAKLVCLCRRHHRLKTHAPDWVFRMDPDGTLHVTPPGGHTRTTRPECIADVDMSTCSPLDTLSDLFGPTPKRFRSRTPAEREQRRADAVERARLAADIEAELDAALDRLTAPRVAGEQRGVGASGAALDGADESPVAADNAPPAEADELPPF